MIVVSRNIRYMRI